MTSKLGYGIGLRPKHFPALLAQPELPIDWLEIVSENYMGVGGRGRSVLQTLRERYPIAAHGVGLSIAGSDPLDAEYLLQLKRLCAWLEPAMVTDHLCWTSWKGHHSYDLLPFPLNEASLDHIAHRVHHVQEYLGRRILLENPSCYIDFRSSSLSEPEFLATLCQRTGCGILLDLNNCVVNSRNLGWDPAEYLQKLDPSSVGQFHLAGHAYEAEISIDTHDHAVPEAVWQLYEKALRRFPDASVLVEWDDQIPELEGLIHEVAIARRRAEAAVHHAHDPRPAALASPQRIGAEALTLKDEQEQFFQAILSRDPTPQFLAGLVATPAGADRGLYVYQSAYPARLTEVLQATYPSLHFILEDELFAALAEHFFSERPLDSFSINYVGEGLPEFLATVPSPFSFGAPQSALAALAAFDWAHYELCIRPDHSGEPLSPDEMLQWDAETWEDQKVLIAPETTLLKLDWQIFDVWTAIRHEEVPEPPAEGPELCLFKRCEGQIAVEHLPFEAEALWSALEAGASLAECVACCGAEDEEEAVHTCIKILMTLASQGLLLRVPQPPASQAFALQTLGGEASHKV